QRENNRYPRRNDPFAVAVSARGDIAVATGAVYAWVDATVANIRDGKIDHRWELKRGLSDPPTWFPDGARILVGAAADAAALPSIATSAVGGAQRTVSHGAAPAAAADGTIYAARGDRIVRLGDGSDFTVAHRPGESLENPLPSPDGGSIVYSAARNNQVDLWIVHRNGTDDRKVLGWDRDRMVYRWAPDGSRLYAVVGGDWDWQIWEIPLAAGGVNVLAR